jgi:hypothetical protein
MKTTIKDLVLPTNVNINVLYYKDIVNIEDINNKVVGLAKINKRAKNIIASIQITDQYDPLLFDFHLNIKGNRLINIVALSKKYYNEVYS